MSEKTPFLSVIVPAYNVEKYIDACVKSILQQSYKDFELLLVDDGSGDATGDICDQYAEQDARIQVIHKENGGLVSARKAGVMKAIGQYVTYVDGDDWIGNNMFEEMCEKACETGADIIIADYVAVGRTKENLTQNISEGFYDKKNLQKNIYPEMLSKGEYFSFGFQPSLCGRLFRRKILVPHQMKVDNVIRLGEDAACSYACFLEADAIYYLKNHFFYYYRMRETSISHAIVHTYYTTEILALGKILKEEFTDYTAMKSELLPQLYMYICYMLDNMISSNISFREIFITREIKKQLQLFYTDSFGKEVICYVSACRTSSRMKRILKLAQKNNLVAAIELYSFYRYEKWKDK